MSGPSNTTERIAHWENIYTSRPYCEMSWYQHTPEQSLLLIHELDLRHDAPIIDVGGGDALLSEHLLGEGYSNLTVLDISATAIQRAQQRLGESATKINWENQDMLTFQRPGYYKLWHDRAAFHFLREPRDIRQYVENVNTSLTRDGFLIIGTFAEDGPEKCSGIEIKRYSAEQINEVFSDHFKRLTTYSHHHITPTGKTQHFLFSVFRKRL